ncbi:hypothetical protein ABQE62_29960 [Mycolicibacterium fortuitum]
MPEDQTPDVMPVDSETPEVIDQTDPVDEPEDVGDEETFDAQYVAQLKQEAIDHRQNAKALATLLHTELVRATGRLADPSDLAFDNAHLDSPEALNAAIDELLSIKPHFASRTPHGSVGQGVKDGGAPQLNLMAELKKLV